ncbi:MAG TPA: hypothetical protein H9866_00930 [Candidatus Tidjanibacter gallistercoris]|nr:hypothetical protein [Candidatus Tidjanibacter gallistercoris]
MTKALFYKEWIKTRRSVLLIVAVMAAGAAYSFVNTAQTFRVHGAVQVWNAVIVKDAAVLPELLRWLPAGAGILLALSQFVPEMTGSRLKLTLHLPLPEGRIVATMLGYGIAVLAAVFLAAYAAVTAGIAIRYPAETVRNTVVDAAPWFLAGLFAYLAAAGICLEPSWKYRLSCTAAALCLAPAFFIDAPAGAYAPCIPYLSLLIVLCCAFPFHSTARFKDGAR